MLSGNVHKYSEVAKSLGYIDSRFWKQGLFDNKRIINEQPELINDVLSTRNFQNEKNSFLDQAISFVKKNIANDSFDYSRFAKEMNVSKSTLYKKINLYIGISPSELIWSVRIKKALQLLSNNSFNISEIAFQVGFKDPKYFSRCFKHETGLTPREYRKSIAQDLVSSDNQTCNKLFLEKVLAKLEIKISDESFSNDHFATEMNMSESSLHRKLKSVTGLSIREFVRTFRIKHAARLLTKSLNIQEIAFAVGFNDSKYFSRCFKCEFGLTPTQYHKFFSRTEARSFNYSQMQVRA